MVEATAPDRRARSLPIGERVLVPVVALASALPTLVAGWRAGWGWMPVGDAAAIALRATDVWTTNSPLVGMPTTLSDTVGVQVHHPGPMEFWVISLFQVVLGHPAAPMLAMVAVNALSAVAVVGCARWAGGAFGAIVAGVWVTLASWSLRGDVLIEPYNPYAGHLPLAAYLAAVVAVGAGQRWALPIAVVAGTYAAHAHVSLLAPVGAAAIAVVVLALVRQGTIRSVIPTVRRELRRFPAPCGVALGAAIVLWLPVLVDLVAGNRNLLRLATSGGTEGDTLGPSRAAQVVGRALISPGWLGDDRLAFDVVAPIGTAGRVLAVLLVVAAAAMAVRMWRRRPWLSDALVAALASLVAGGLAIAQIPTGIFNLFALPNYLWLWPVSGLFWIALLAGIGFEVSDRGVLRLPVSRLPPTQAAGVAVVAGLALLASSAPVRMSTAAEHVPPTAALSDTLAETLDRDRTYLIEFDPFIERAAVAMGLLIELERRGFDLVIRPEEGAMYGEHRAMSPDQQIAGALVVLQDPELPPAPHADAELLAVFRPDPEDLDRWRTVGEELAEAIDDGGGLVIGLELDRPDEAATRAAIEERAVLGWWDFGLIVSPELDEDLMARYRRSANAPIVEVGVYLMPAELP